MTKEQLQHSFPKVQFDQLKTEIGFAILNFFPIKILRYSTWFSGLHQFKPWEQGCEVVSLSMNILAALTARIFGRVDFFLLLVVGKRHRFRRCKICFYLKICSSLRFWIIYLPGKYFKKEEKSCFKKNVFKVEL